MFSEGAGFPTNQPTHPKHMSNWIKPKVWGLGRRKNMLKPLLSYLLMVQKSGEKTTWDV